mmetsp:Transcript_107376/g.346542  ORF Transcript_107376/g.346542 Transcript_107376/m.346542 type:complete len:208 (+) Transcript_107376:455-1078(+)
MRSRSRRSCCCRLAAQPGSCSGASRGACSSPAQTAPPWCCCRTAAAPAAAPGPAGCRSSARPSGRRASPQSPWAAPQQGSGDCACRCATASPRPQLGSRCLQAAASASLRRCLQPAALLSPRSCWRPWQSCSLPCLRSSCHRRRNGGSPSRSRDWRTTAPQHRRQRLQLLHHSGQGAGDWTRLAARSTSRYSQTWESTTCCGRQRTP